MAKKWEKAEEDFLIKKYPFTTNRDLAKIPELKNHPLKSIESKARALDLVKDSSFISATVARTNSERKEVDLMELTKLSDQELLEETSRRGYIASRREVAINLRYKFPRPLKPLKLGVVSDTHFGSVHQQRTLLHEAYAIFKAEGVKTVLHAGDMVEGNGHLYKGQQFEMFIHGADAMVDYAVENYPRVDGITTHIIGGSHDYSFYKSEGYDVLAAIADRRKDIKHLGVSGAWLSFGRILIYLMHGDSGNAYARSYRQQKIIEMFPAGEKPHVLLLGHYHTTCELPSYRGVAGFQLPCFQTQTQYMRAKGLNPDIGFLILTIYPDVKGVAHFVPDWRFFHVPVKGDF